MKSGPIGGLDVNRYNNFSSLSVTVFTAIRHPYSNHIRYIILQGTQWLGDAKRLKPMAQHDSEGDVNCLKGS